MFLFYLYRVCPREHHGEISPEFFLPLIPFYLHVVAFNSILLTNCFYVRLKMLQCPVTPYNGEISLKH